MAETWTRRRMSDDSGWIVAFQNGPGPRVLIPQGPPEWKSDERSALIANAPELLAALKNLTTASELIDDAYYDAIDTAIIAARVAIARAEGGAA